MTKRKRTKKEKNKTKQTNKQTSNDIRNITQKTKDRASRTSLETRGVLRCSTMVWFCSTCVLFSTQSAIHIDAICF